MTDNQLGTLPGLIADLEEKHPMEMLRGTFEVCGSPECKTTDIAGVVHTYWPCPTTQIVQTHKRAMLQDGYPTGQKNAGKT